MSRIFEISSPSGHRQYTGEDLPLVIGTGRQAHVRIPAGPEVAARVAVSRGYLFLQPGPGSRILHNATLITGSVWIKSGDRFRIGAILLHFHLSGDLVEIRVDRADQAGPEPDSALLEEPFPESAPAGRRLPRARMEPPRPRRSLWLVTGILFLVLLLSAAFVLTARFIEIEITPAPDSLALEGFPPALALAGRFVGLPGTYTVRAGRQGYRELVRTITVTDRTTNHFTFSLEKRPGIVSILSEPTGATVQVDGRVVGSTPLAGLELAAGPHRLRLTLDRYLDLEQEVAVEGLGRRQRFRLYLQPGWGEVRLDSEPSGALVLEGEEELGRTPLATRLMAGRHRLLLRRAGYEDGLLEVVVEAGESTVPERVALVPVPARVEVSSSPGGAAVSVDAVFRGRTPVTVAVSSKQEHEFHLRLAGHRPVTVRKRFAPAADSALRINLEPEYGTIFVSSDPPDAELLVDGTVHGQATGRLRLTTVEHVLTVRASGYRSVTRKVTPAAGVSRQIEIRLPRVSGKVAAASVPAAASTKVPGPGAEMIILGPARFRMGASRREPGRRANEQQRDIELRRRFALSVRPVSNGEFRRFRPGHRSGVVGGYSLDGDRQPVVRVSWDDAARYCNWLSDRRGLPRFYREQGGHMVAVTPPTTGYRLPTEAEWAYAARVAGRDRPARYPWPGAFPPPVVRANLADESARGLLAVVISGYNDGHAVTAPAGSYPANPGGFFDMGGNVAQWCHDYYTPYTEAGTARPAVDPLGPATGSHHVLRGSGWRDGAITELRLNYRGYGRKGRDDLGFRIARYLP